MARSTDWSTDGDVEARSMVGIEDVDLDIVGSIQGYILEEKKLSDQVGLTPNANVKRAPNGTVLIPQPSEDPEDPLNWSDWKKAGILLVVVANSFPADYSVVTGASAIISQAQQWHISPDTVNHATAGMTFMLAVGGLATVWLSAYIGRLPVLFWFSLISLGMAAWSAVAKSFKSYMAARILHGTFVVAAAAGGLMWIKDVWFFHEHPRKINILSTAIIVSPYLGPQIMAAIISGSSWRVGMWLCFSIIAFGVLCTVLLGDETSYPRHLPREQIPVRKSRMLRLIGLEQTRTNWTTNNFLEAGARLGRTLMRLPVLITCLYYLLDFSWTIGVNTTMSVFVIPIYNFTYRDLAAIYSAPIVGAMLALLFGHFVFDLIGDKYAKRHQGRLDPENRLIMLWIIFPIQIAGHNIIGQALQHHWSYWVLAVGWAMHNFTMVLTTASVGAYLIDAYPEAAGESGAWLCATRTVGGFVVGYVQIPWSYSTGPAKEYGIQSAIMGGAFAMVVFLQFYGMRLRHRQGPLRFKTN